MVGPRQRSSWTRNGLDTPPGLAGLRVKRVNTRSRSNKHQSILDNRCHARWDAFVILFRHPYTTEALYVVSIDLCERRVMCVPQITAHEGQIGRASCRATV